MAKVSAIRASSQQCDQTPYPNPRPHNAKPLLQVSFPIGSELPPKEYGKRTFAVFAGGFHFPVPSVLYSRGFQTPSFSDLGYLLTTAVAAGVGIMSYTCSWPSFGSSSQPCFPTNLKGSGLSDDCSACGACSTRYMCVCVCVRFRRHIRRHVRGGVLQGSRRQTRTPLTKKLQGCLRLSCHNTGIS